MDSKLVKVGNAYTEENAVERRMREAFEAMETSLRPPFCIKAPPSTSHHNNLCLALVYAILTEPDHFTTHTKHLHAIVADGYCFFVSSLTSVVLHLFPVLLPSPISQLLLLTHLMLHVSAVGFSSFVPSLLRRILPGDLSSSHISFSSRLLTIFAQNIHPFLHHDPSLLSMALYTFLRLLPFHYSCVRTSSSVNLLVKMEVDFCVSILRFHFHLGLAVGRDLVRLLLDLVHVPQFKDLWRDLVLYPDRFCTTTNFSDVSQIYEVATPGFFFLLRIPPEMEVQLRFLLSRVRLGAQKRYQLWFGHRFLSTPARESCICDIVRFVCCAHHPSNEVIQSDVIPRWAVLGWLIKCCRMTHVESCVMLPMFYDWLFFNGKVDNVMNIEPAILLMVNSVSKYVDITNSLLNFLFILVDNYDVGMKGIISQGVLSSFHTVVAKGVVRSLEVLTSSEAVTPYLRERLGRFISATKSLPIQNDVVCNSNEGCEDPLSSWMQDLQETCGKTNVVGLYILKDVISNMCLCDSSSVMSSGRGTLVLRDLSLKLTKELELNGCRLFSPIDGHTSDSIVDDEVFSPTSLLIRAFIFNPTTIPVEMMWCWSRSGLPVGTRLLFYASRLAFEFELLGVSGTLVGDKFYSDSMASCSPFLKNHIDMYIYSMRTQKRCSHGYLCSLKLDKKLMSDLIDYSFSAYRCFLMYSSEIMNKNEGDAISPSELLFADIVMCLKWDRRRLKFLFSGVFGVVFKQMMVGGENIRLMLEVLDHTDLLDIQFDLRLKRFSIFGMDPIIICGIIRTSISWDLSLQVKLWGLLRSEIPVSSVQFEKIMLDFFCSYSHVALKHVNTFVAVEGFMSVCTSLPPTPELVGALMLFPNTPYPYFTSAVMAAWEFSNTSMLFESARVFLQKLQKSGEHSPACLEGFIINQSAIDWLLSHGEHRRGSKSIESFYGVSANMIEKLREMSRGFIHS